jgi:hypothetical protein
VRTGIASRRSQRQQKEMFRDLLEFVFFAEL